MNNFLISSDFEIEKYVNTSYPLPREDLKMAPIRHSNEVIEKAKAWSLDSGIPIIYPMPTIEELDELWIKYNNTFKKKRRESDWKSLELFNVNNQDHYEALRNVLLKDRIPVFSDPMEEYSPSHTSDSGIQESASSDLDNYKIDYDAINYTTTEVDSAITAANLQSVVIIVPTTNLEDLENLWDNFNLMPKPWRRKSDWISIEIFGITNQTHYEYLKSKFLEEDIGDSYDGEYMVESVYLNDYVTVMTNTLRATAVSENTYEFLKTALNSISLAESVYEDALISNVITDLSKSYGDMYSDIEFSPTFSDLPAFTPEEMIDMGVFSGNPEQNYYGEEPISSYIDEGVKTEEWFESYKAKFSGTKPYKPVVSEASRIRAIFKAYGMLLAESTSPTPKVKKLNSIKQYILELGWNPNIDPRQPENRVMIDEIQNIKVKNNYGTTRFIDLREFKTSKSVISNYNESAVELHTPTYNLHPIYLKLVENGSDRVLLFGDKNYTNFLIPKSSDGVVYNENTTIDVFCVLLPENFTRYNAETMKSTTPDYMYTNKKMVVDGLRQLLGETGYKYDKSVYHIYSGPSMNYVAGDSVDIIESIIYQIGTDTSLVERFIQEDANIIYGIRSNLDNINALIEMKPFFKTLESPYKQLIESVLEPCITPKRCLTTRRHMTQRDLDMYNAKHANLIY